MNDSYPGASGPADWSGDLPIPADATAGHFDLDAAADLDEGLLEPAVAAAVEAHAGSCESCAQTLASVRSVRALLTAEPPVGALPDDVAARLAALTAYPAHGSGPSLVGAATDGHVEDGRAAEGGGEEAGGAAVPQPVRTEVVPFRRPRRDALAAVAKPLLAVASVVLGLVLVVNLPTGGGSTDEDTSASSAGSAADAPAARTEAAEEGPAAAMAAPEPAASTMASSGASTADLAGTPLPVDDAGLARVARDALASLASLAAVEEADRKGAALPPACSALDLEGVDAVVDGSWEGQPALLVVQREGSDLRLRVLASPCGPAEASAPLRDVRVPALDPADPQAGDGGE